MAIKGSLKEASLPDVLQLLSMGKKTGCLGLSFHDSFGSIYFDNGRICHAAIVNRPLDTENSVYTLFTWTSGTFNFDACVTGEMKVRNSRIAGSRSSPYSARRSSTRLSLVSWK